MKLEETLAAAAAESCESWVSRRTAGYDPEEKHDFTPAFEKRLRRLRRRADHPALYPVLRRAAAVVLALLLAGAVLLAVDEEARAAVFGWITETISTYFVYNYVGEEDSSDFSDYRPSWLPDGFSESAEKASEKRTRVNYVNDNDGSYIVFIYYRNLDEPSVFVEASDTDAVKVQVNGCSAMLFLAEKEDVTSAITWVSSDDTLVYISGYLEASDLMKMAESVERIP